MGLAGPAGSRIAGYSGGMRQRLGIARALVNDPAVVFLDEPTLGLHPAGQRQVFGIVRELARRGGAAVVLSTHTLPEVEEVCTCVLILDRGKIAAAGPVGEVVAAAAARCTARLRVPAGSWAGPRKPSPWLPGCGSTRPTPIPVSCGSRGADTDGGPGGAPAKNDALHAVLGAEVPSCPSRSRVHGSATRSSR
jgi:ABC-2 type transport system ATP-binding protein